MMFLIGCDPELFLRKGDTFVSAETADGPLIPGTKKNPYEVRGGAVQVDGVAAEFNINAAKDFKEFFGNTKSVMTELKKMVKAKDPTISLVANPTATFDSEYFRRLPKHTLELGCEPDYSAYTMKANPRPSTDKPFRTGSGHIHIGWRSKGDPYEEGHMLDCAMVVKELDLALHYASLSWDTDKARQELYGKPGSFRPKTYGVEYRPLSNAWLRDPSVLYDVYKITMGVLRSIDSGNHNLGVGYEGSYGETNRDKVLNALGAYTYDL